MNEILLKIYFFTGGSQTLVAKKKKKKTPDSSKIFLLSKNPKGMPILEF